MRTWTIFILITTLASLRLAFAGDDHQRPQYLKRLAGEAKRLEEKRDVKADDGLRQFVEAVRISFEDGDTDLLETCLSERKIYVSLKSRPGEAGYYTRSQLRFIFEKLFQERESRSFEYNERDLEVPEEDRAVLRASWTYMILDSDKVVTEHLRFMLDHEKEGWRVSEIKASSR